MITVIFLDAEPLGLVIHPTGGEDARRCNDWFEAGLLAGNKICIPAIADYEVRRELIRAGRQKSLDNLEELTHEPNYLPILGETIRVATELLHR